MNDHVITISKSEEKNSSFLEYYLKNYNNKENVLTYGKSFKNYLYEALCIDEPSVQGKNLVVKIDNYWPREDTGIVSLIKKHSVDKYYDFDKTHNFLAFNGGNFEDCVFIDMGKEKTYKDLMNSGAYGYCKSNEDGTNDRFQCQRIGAAVLSTLITAGATLFTTFGTTPEMVVLNTSIGMLLTDMAISEYNKNFYSKGYIDSYIGDKLAELGALSIACGVSTFEGIVNDIQSAMVIAATLGIIRPEIKGTKNLDDICSEVVKNYNEMQLYDGKENGKRPEDIYRESVRKFNVVLDNIDPFGQKLRATIICGSAALICGASTGILLDGGLSVGVALGVAVGGGIGSGFGYVFHQELTDGYIKAENWIKDLFTGQLFQSEIENNESKNIDQIIEENISRIKRNQNLLYNKSEVIQNFKKDQGYDPLEEMYRSRFSSRSSSLNSSFCKKIEDEKQNDNKTKHKIR